MTLNIQKLHKVVKAAKGKTNDRRWMYAVDKAADAIIFRGTKTQILRSAGRNRQKRYR